MTSITSSIQLRVKLPLFLLANSLCPEHPEGASGIESSLERRVDILLSTHPFAEENQANGTRSQPWVPFHIHSASKARQATESRARGPGHRASCVAIHSSLCSYFWRQLSSAIDPWSSFDSMDEGYATGSDKWIDPC